MGVKSYLMDSADSLFTAEELSFWQTYFLTAGVLNTNGDNTDLKIVERSTGANRSVDCGLGIAVVEITKNGSTYKIVNANTAVQNIIIPTNSTGVTRYDTIIARVDVNTDLNLLKNNIFTIERIGGQATNALTDSDIDTLVDGDGWIRLADLTLLDGYATIVNADITDQRIPVTMANDSLMSASNFQILTHGETIANGVPVCLKASDNKVYKTKADDPLLINYIGMSVASIGNGQIIVASGGLNDKVSGLVAGTIYYLGNTAGTLSTTAGTYAVVAGKALSATKFLIIPSAYGAISDSIKQFLNDGTAGETLVSGDYIYLKASDGKLWKTDADANESTYKAVGRIVLGGNADATVYYSRPFGITESTGLTAGDLLWFSDTAGAVGNTPNASRPLPAGLALSATKAMLASQAMGMKIRTMTQALDFSNGADVTVAVGFRPFLILASYVSTNGTIGIAHGTTSMCVTTENDGSGHSTISPFILKMGATTNYTAYSVANITATGFDLIKTKASTGGGLGSLTVTLTIIGY